jgi:maleylacetoacetate isomerase
MSEEFLRLHGFFTSSALYRVRIALNLNGLSWEHVGVNICNGAQHAPSCKAINPAAAVPTLEIGERRFTHPPRIIDNLDRLGPEPRPVPESGPARDRVGSGLLAVGYCNGWLNSPVFNYPFSRTRDALDALRRAGALDAKRPSHAVR